MPYIQEVCVAGKVIEIEKRYSSRYGKKYIRRSPNHSPTPEKQKIINERNAIKKLRRLLNENFTPDDIHLSLKYSNDKRPATPEQAKKELEKFLRKLRRHYKKIGKELKYVHTTEYKRNKIHHHLVINDPPTMKEIRTLWGNGRPWSVPLDENGSYAGLAEYLIKETRNTFNEDGVTKKRWCQSRNLKKPKVDVTVVKRKTFREYPQAFKGYILEDDLTKQGVHEVTGCEFQFYSMVRIE